MPTRFRKLCKKELSLSCIILQYPKVIIVSFILTSFKMCVLHNTMTVCCFLLSKSICSCKLVYENKCMFNDKIVLSKTKSIMLSHDYLIIKDYLEVTWGRYSLKNPNDQAPQSFGQRKNFILLSH